MFYRRWQVPDAEALKKIMQLFLCCMLTVLPQLAVQLPFVRALLRQCVHGAADGHSVVQIAEI